MSNIILPDDPNFNKPVVMGDPFTVDPARDLHKQGITPNTIRQERDRQRDNAPGTFKYAETLIAHAPDSWVKQAQQAGANNVMTQPMWFSPLHTPQNWQIASKRREVYQWSFVCSNKNACFLTNYGDFSLIPIKDVYTKFKSKNVLYIQNDKGEKARPDICTKRYVEKKVNKFKILGTPHSLEVTHDHKCMIIKREQVKCTNKQCSKSKNCISDVNSSGCIRAKCYKYKTINYKISTINAENVRKGDYVLCPFSTKIRKSIIKTVDQARFAGHLASDGDISQNPKHPSTRICMNVGEIDYVFPVIKTIYENYGVVAKLEAGISAEVKVSRTGKTALYQESSSKLVIGIRENKKYTEEVMLLNPKLQKHVLGAYIQSDGSYNKINEQIEITSCSKHLANQLQIMCYRCGIMAFSSMQPRRFRTGFKTKNTHYYMICIPKTFVHLIKEYVPGKIPSEIYEPTSKCIYKNKKHLGETNTYFKKGNHEITRINKRFFWKNYVVSPVVSNTYRHYKGDVYDIRVPPTHAITANGIAIHQCRFFYENEPKVAAAIDFYCFVPETQILMSSGSQKSISSIETGDLVRSHDGTVNQVIRTFSRKIDEEILSIKITGISLGQALRVTKGHELLTKKDGVIKFVQAQNLQAGDYLLTPVEYSDAINDKTVDNKICNTSCYKESKYIYRKIRSVKYNKYIGTVYDLEIENSHSYVANRISCHNSRFPMNGFKLECINRKILSFFDHHIVKKLQLNERIKEISSEYYMLGDVFIHTDIKCDICFGVGFDPDTQEPCDHPGGGFKRIFVMNPDWIEVQKSPLTDEPLVVLIPDEELQQIVHKRSPKPIYDRIPDHLKPLIIAKAPIPLSNRTLSHIKHMSVPYGTYGTSIIRRLFTTLAYKTKIMTANWIVAERLILPVRVVKIGSDDRPATTTDIADIQTQLGQVANDPNLTIVTHHNFEYEWYGCIVDDDADNSNDINSYQKGVYVITDEGPKRFKDLKVYTKIANVYTNGELSYDNCIRKVHFDYNKDNSSGEIYEIGNHFWTLKTTPNHRHYLSNGDIKRSDELKKGDELFLPSQWSWSGSVPGFLPYKDCNSLSHLSLEEYCRFMGYFISEGDTTFDKNASVKNEEDKIRSCKISQSVNSPYYQDMKEICEKIRPTMWIGKDKRRKEECHYFNMSDCKLVQYLAKECGTHATNKHVPSWMLQLPKKHLIILLNAMIDGDGRRYGTKISYSTVSEKLKDQICELFTKIGYSPYIKKEIVNKPNCNDIYRIRCSSLSSPTKFKIQDIEKKNYDGKMWCLEMYSGNFFILVDGHLILTGNTSGKVLQITQEMEHIDKELLDGLMLNQALLNGEMSGYQCHDEETEVLTDSGFKKYADVYTNNRIAAYNVYTNQINYEIPLDKYEYDYDGELVNFSGEQLDVMVTPNHKMLVKCGNEWATTLAEHVKQGMRFLAHSEYKPDSEIEDIFVDDVISINAKKYFEYAGYYLSEGHMSCKKGNYQISISQSKSSHVLQSMGSCVGNMGMKYNEYDYGNRDVNSITICNKTFVKHMKENFGSHAENKSVPSWMKNASIPYLSILLKSLMDGDGQTIVHKNTENHVYTTISEDLADDVQEIAFKCGYNARKAIHVDTSKDINSKSRLLYRVKFSKGKWSKSNEPRLKKQHINKVPYKGKVWCFTTSTGFFVTRRNGKITIQGNSAQVGVETLIRRIESWRGSLAEWIQDRVFKPIAEMQGFIDEEKSEEVGEIVFQHPTVKWNDLELKDQTQYHQMLMQLHDKQVISTQTLLEEIGMNYDQEVKRMRYEQAQMGPMGAQMGQGAGGADPMGGIGGGMGGGAGAEDGEAMPGAGMDPMGGGTGDMGLSGGGGGAAAAGATASSGKITKKGKGNQGKEEEVAPMMPIKLTKIEQKMAGILEEIANTMGFPVGNIRMQFPVENPKGGKAFSMDFAIPAIKMDIECLLPNTSLMTPDGMKTAKTVKIGDYLYDRNGIPTKVVNMFCREYNKTVCEVQAPGIIPFVVTAKHKLLVSKSYETRVKREEPTKTREYMQSRDPEFIEIKDVSPGDYILFPKKTGIVVAQFLLEKINKYSYKKKVPEFMFFVSDDCKKAYFRSLLEGDRCLQDDNYDNLRIKTSSKQLALGLQKLAATLGVWAPIIKSKDEGTCNIRGRTGKCKELWDIAINFNPKKKVYREDENYFYIRIRSITHQEYDGLVYNFTTEDHTYNINNIVSKNSDGEVWHSSEEQKTSDQDRDYLLAQRGWTVLRFDDKSIEESTQQVSATINSYIDKAMKSGGNKQASMQNGKDTIGYFVSFAGNLKDFGADASKYYGYLSRVYPERMHQGKEFI